MNSIPWDHFFDKDNHHLVYNAFKNLNEKPYSPCDWFFKIENTIQDTKRSVIYDHWKKQIIKNFIIINRIIQLLNFSFPKEIISYINKIYLLYEQQQIHYLNICYCENNNCKIRFNYIFGTGSYDLHQNQFYTHCAIQGCHEKYYKRIIKNNTYDVYDDECYRCQRDICRFCILEYIDGISGVITCYKCR